MSKITKKEMEIRRTLLKKDVLSDEEKIQLKDLNDKVYSDSLNIKKTIKKIICLK